jgi:hypothetical protein
MQRCGFAPICRRGRPASRISGRIREGLGRSSGHFGSRFIVTSMNTHSIRKSNRAHQGTPPRIRGKGTQLSIRPLGPLEVESPQPLPKPERKSRTGQGHAGNARPVPQARSELSPGRAPRRTAPRQLPAIHNPKSYPRMGRCWFRDDRGTRGPFQGRFNRERWRPGREELFRTHELVHNRRRTVHIVASAEGDGAFAAVDVDTMCRRQADAPAPPGLQGHSRVGGAWSLIFHTGLLRFGKQ